MAGSQGPTRRGEGGGARVREEGKARGTEKGERWDVKGDKRGKKMSSSKRDRLDLKGCFVAKSKVEKVGKKIK